jgi:hypothetical protein
MQVARPAPRARGGGAPATPEPGGGEVESTRGRGASSRAGSTGDGRARQSPGTKEIKLGSEAGVVARWKPAFSESATSALGGRQGSRAARRPSLSLSSVARGRGWVCCLLPASPCICMSPLGRAGPPRRASLSGFLSPRAPAAFVPIHNLSFHGLDYPLNTPH